MSPLFSFRRSFFEDSRGGRIEDSQTIQPSTGTSSTKLLYIEGPANAVAQIRMASPGCLERAVHDDWKHKYSYGLEFPNGIPGEIYRLVELLTNDVLTLQTRADVDAAVALDWYKVPEDGVDPREWRNTTDADLLYRSKYRADRPSAQALVARYLEVIDAHPLFRSATTIVTVPGHNADGKSFGEGLARRLGSETGKTVVQTASNGPHVESKTGAARNYGDFRMTEAISGDALVIDDVYMTGMSMAVVAHAAKQAGAARVFGLVAARTLRK